MTEIAPVPLKPASISPPPPRPTAARRVWLHLAIDVVLVFLGFVIAYWMRYIVSWPPPLESIVSEVATENFVALQAFLPISLLLMLLLVGQFLMRGLYRLPRTAGVIDHMGIIISSTTVGIAILIVFVFLYRPFFYSRLIFGFAWCTIITLMALWRALLIGTRRWRWLRGHGRERILVVGGTGLARFVMEGIVAQPDMGFELAGYLDDRDHAAARPTRHFRHLGLIGDLEKLVRSDMIDQVIIALPFWEHHRLPELVNICREAHIDFRVAPDLYELSFDRVDVSNIGGVPLIGLKEVSLRGLNMALKRAIDIVLVVLAAPVVLLLSAGIALAIRLDSPGPIIFRQTRVGRNERPFTVYKFRTMVVDAEARKAELAALNEADGPLFKIRDDPRRTWVGSFLRRYSLDELPQLWNILLGEMSWVGPRPPTPDEVAQYENWHRRRLEVLPGLTGLWQVLGRSDTSFDEMVRLDIYYAESWSLGLDLRIMLQTIPVVLGGRGAY
ncbi:MAG TPA: sugar transferase [Roseiflexaceae bacterium]|nr:sugar transferase [Roseiflexaceae bacterium]HMP39459.1 sugar transferase [Roseiflexaceae bacterium]